MIGILIPAYNMLKQACILADHIYRNTRFKDYQIFIISNGSQENIPNRKDIIVFPDKLFMTHALLSGMAYLDSLEYVKKVKWFAYWIVTTSVEFQAERDYLTPMVEYMKSNSDVVITSPFVAGTAWDSMSSRTTGIRETWGVDNIAKLVRKDWFDSVGRYDPEVVMGWGSSLETCWMARRDKKKIAVFDDLLMKKHDGIAHSSGARDLSREDFNFRAATEMNTIFSRKYGPNALDKLGHEYR